MLFGDTKPLKSMANIRSVFHSFTAYATLRSVALLFVEITYFQNLFYPAIYKVASGL